MDLYDRYRPSRQLTWTSAWLSAMLTTATAVLPLLRCRTHAELPQDFVSYLYAQAIFISTSPGSAKTRVIEKVITYPAGARWSWLMATKLGFRITCFMIVVISRTENTSDLSEMSLDLKLWCTQRLDCI